MNRRTLLLSAGAMLAAGTMVSSESQAAGRRGRRGRYMVANTQVPTGLQFNNADFYTADGKFNEDKAKDAILALCRYFNYPIYPDLKERLWVSDYGTGKYTELGLACILFVNNDKEELGQTFMLQDLFMLPGQMLPEHWHIKGDGITIKNEGWVVRNGKSFVVGIGEDNLPEELKIPECHMGGKVEVKHGRWLNPGEYAQLVKVETKHWQMAGPEGCIISEVANLHTNSAVRHNDPAINDNFLGK